MGTIAITLFEFGLFINHADGITVIFPEEDHALVLEVDGRSFAIDHGANLELRGPGGAELSKRRPAAVDYAKYVVDLEAAEATKIPVPADLLDPSVRVDPARVNGRLFLRGGTIVGKECSIAANRVPFNFRGGQMVVTDTAVFQLPIPDGEVFEFWVNGRKALDVTERSVIRLNNSDALGGALKSFEALDEFVLLCQVLGHRASGTPTIADGPIRPQGGHSNCAIAQISA